MPHSSIATAEHDSAVRPRIASAGVDAENASLVAVTGELDIATVPHLDQALRRAETDGGLVVLDLRALELIDSSGPHLVLAAARRMRQPGGRLVVVRGGEQVEWFWPSVARTAPAVRERVPA
jgi:anti-anti-sigma factor